MCGGTWCAFIQEDRSQGLSPRVRGNRYLRSAAISFDRSIPACAGEPPDAHIQNCVLRVYPRVCGGTLAGRGIGQWMSGLSPRVRGNLPVSTIAMSAHGSIPACAGEPRLLGTTHCLSRVYPRVCGGTPVDFKVEDFKVEDLEQGLSPRVRGNRQRYRCPPAGNGSIPACAGEPWTFR